MISSKKRDPLAELVHHRLLALRNIETLIEQREFQQVYDAVSDPERKRAKDFINQFNFSALRTWWRERKNEQLGLLGVRDLRRIASQLGVLNYNTLSKSLLLSEITRLQSNGKGNIGAVDNIPSSGNEGSGNQSGNSGGEVPADPGTNGREHTSRFAGVAYVDERVLQGTV